MQRPLFRRALVPVLILSVGLFVGSLVGGTALANHQFSDVGPNNEFHDHIDWLSDHGITSGFPDGTFRPTQPVTRQAMAAFLARSNDNLRVATHTEDPGSASTFVATAPCEPDERAVAGGGFIDLADIFLTTSRPAGGDQGWTVAFESEGSVARNPTRIDVWALCVPDQLRFD